MSSARPPSSSSTMLSTVSTTPSAGKTTNSAVLEQLLSQIDRQEDRVTNLERNFQQQSRLVKSLKDTTHKQDEQIQQQQLLISNLLQQQSSLFTMLGNSGGNIALISSAAAAAANGATSIQSPTSTSGSIPSSTASPQNGSITTNELNELQHTIISLNTKLSLKEQQLKDQLAISQEQQQNMNIMNQAYHQQSQEIDKLNAIIQQLKVDLQTVRHEFQTLSTQNGDNQVNQLMKIKPVYESLEMQLNRLEKETQQQSKTAIQLIIKTLVGRAIIVDCDISDTIAFVKHKINENLGIPTSAQILLNNGKELPNDSTILSLNLLTQTTLHLILKNRGK